MTEVFTALGYDPRNWFWVVADDTSRAWSSVASAYVENFDAERVTRIGSEAELNDVLRPYGLTLPAPTVDDYKVAIQAHIDAVARAKDYDNGVSLAGYKGSSVEAYAADAEAFTAWRDPLWPAVFSLLAGVQSGTIQQPSIAGLIGMLPDPPWPIE